MKTLKTTFYILTLSLFFMSCSSSEVVPPGGGNGSGSGGSGSTTKTTYDKDIKTLINNSCATASCHDTSSPAAGLSLTTFAQVKNAAQNGNLFTRVNNNTMPPSPNSPLSNTNKALLEKWKTDGYLEN